MILKFLLLICYVTLLIFPHSMSVQNRNIIRKKDSTPCTPHIKQNTESSLLQLDNTLNDLKSNKENISRNLEVSYSLQFATSE